METTGPEVIRVQAGPVRLCGLCACPLPRWSQAWDLPAQRKVAYAQLKDLAEAGPPA